MARALWKGSISFGLVTIPVELMKSVRDNSPHFRMLHAKDKSPVKYERVCEKEGRQVSWDDLVKGYEYEKGKYIVLTRQDFEMASVAKSKQIEILDFVKADEIDERHFETSYFVLPGDGGERAYALLAKAIGNSGKVGIGKIIFREAQHLVALKSLKNALVLDIMRFADELIDVSTLKFPDAASVRPKELQMAESLIESLTDKWAPEKYTDEYRENLMRVIRAKIKGKKPDLKEEEPEVDSSIVDLMERLKQSLTGGKAGNGRGAKRAGASKKTAKKKPIKRRVA